LEQLPAQGLPCQGGTATQVLVVIDYDTLVSGVHGVAQTSTGDVLTAGEARRLACTAGIIPVVLGGKSEILDQGRSSRLFKGPLRIALDVRDRHCRAEGCDIPAAWCEAHHDREPWASGGRTRLQDGLLLCPPPPPPSGPRPALRADPPPEWRPSLPPTVLSQGVDTRRSYVVSDDV
jgi:hypothetical protein